MQTASVTYGSQGQFWCLLMQKLTRWMRNNPEGGLIVFMTSDTDFLKDVNAVVENYNFRAELIFSGDVFGKAPGMREKVNSQGQCHEWMEWLREQMQMPHLQMHTFNKRLEWESPSGSSGSQSLPCMKLTICLLPHQRLVLPDSATTCATPVPTVSHGHQVLLPSKGRPMPAQMHMQAGA